MKDKKAWIGIALFFFGIFVLTYFHELYAGLGHMINGVAFFLLFNFRTNRKIVILSLFLILIGVSLLLYQAAGMFFAHA